MSRYEVAGADVGGVPLYIEISAEGPGDIPGGPRQAAGEIAPEKMLSKLQLAGEAAAQACKSLYGDIDKQFDRLTRPSELAVEFGITLGGEAGIPFVAKGTAEASFKVTATWKQESAPAPAPTPTPTPREG
jgi:hypothetical protein